MSLSNLLPSKPLLGSLLLSGLLAVAFYVHYRNAKEVIQDLTTWQDEMVQSVSLASGGATTKDTARVKVQALGLLRNSLDHANAAIEQMAQDRDVALAKAERERLAKAGAIERAETLSAELRAQAASQAEDTDAAVRHVQDQLYEIGL